MSDLEGIDTVELSSRQDSPLLVIERKIVAARSSRRLTPELIEQLERAWELAGYSYHGQFTTDAEVVRFLLDRLVYIEKVKNGAHDVISKIDWAL